MRPNWTSRTPLPLPIKAVHVATIPKVWAIRTKGWVELRKGAEPTRKTTKAPIMVNRTLPAAMTWSHTLNNYVQETGKTVREKIMLQTTVYLGGTPFKYIPAKQFSRLAGAIQDGEVKLVPPFLAAVWLGLKPERKEAA